MYSAYLQLGLDVRQEPTGIAAVCTFLQGPDMRPRLMPSTGFDSEPTRSNQGKHRIVIMRFHVADTIASPLSTLHEPRVRAAWAAELSSGEHTISETTVKSSSKHSR